jgi:DNA-binding ferritin-like protein
MRKTSTKRLVRAYLSELRGADQGSQVLQAVLGAMRGLHWHYTTAHWQVGGPPQYGDHLLFSRFYEALVPEIDAMAEKLVGYYGTNAVDPCRSLDVTHMFLHGMSGIDCLFERSLKMEETFQQILKGAYTVVKEQTEVMTLGLDDFLMATASAHEANIYLLQQRIYGTCTVPPMGKAASEDISLTNLERSEGGFSTFRPRRHGEMEVEVEVDHVDIEDVNVAPHGECSCGCGRTAASKLDRKTRNQANKALTRAGLDGNGRFEKPDRGYAKAVDVISDYGLEMDEVVSSFSFNRPSGSVTIDLAYTNREDLFSPISIDNAMLVVTWTELRPDYYEVLAYVS